MKVLFKGANIENHVVLVGRWSLTVDRSFHDAIHIHCHTPPLCFPLLRLVIGISYVFDKLTVLSHG